MIDLVRRAAARVRVWNTARLARAAHTAALYGDHRPGRRLVARTVRHNAVRHRDSRHRDRRHGDRRHGAAHHRDGLAAVAAAWCDAYLADTQACGAAPDAPSGVWLDGLLAARTDRGTGEAFTKLIDELPEREIEHCLIELLRMAASARLALDDPDPVWP